MCVASENVFKSDPDKYIETALNSDERVHIATDKGNIVLMSEEQYNSMKETLYILSVAGMREKLSEAQAQSIDTCEEWNGEF